MTLYYLIVAALGLACGFLTVVLFSLRNKMKEMEDTIQFLNEKNTYLLEKIGKAKKPAVKRTKTTEKK